MATYIDLSEKQGHRVDHGFACGAEFNVKIRRRLNIPDFVREQLSESAIDEVWWDEAGRARDSLRDALSRRYKWIGALAFVGRGPGWLAIEDTGCGSRNWDTIGKVVDQHLKGFIKSMESPAFWKAMGVEPLTTKATSHLGRSKVHHATKKTPPAQLQREIDEALALKRDLTDAQGEYRLWARQESLTRDERDRKTQALRRVQELEAALHRKQPLVFRGK
jgi:hypothetical protein